MKLYAIKVVVLGTPLQVLAVGDSEQHAVSKVEEYLDGVGIVEPLAYEVPDAAAHYIRTNAGEEEFFIL